MTQPNPTTPTPERSILNPDFCYTPAAKTDVTRIWVRNGWTQPNKERQRQMMARLNRMTEDQQ